MLKICLPVLYQTASNLLFYVVYIRLSFDRYAINVLTRVIHVITFLRNGNIKRVLQIYNTQIVVVVQLPSCHQVQYSKADYPIKRLHYVSPSFTRQQYKRASVSRKIRQCTPAAKRSGSGRKRNTSSFLFDEVYETRFHDRDVKARSRVPDAVGGF